MKIRAIKRRNDGRYTLAVLSWWYKTDANEWGRGTRLVLLRKGAR